MKTLWARGQRGPGLTELYAALTEDNISDGPLPTALQAAEKICATGLAAGAGGPEWSRVQAKSAKLNRRITAVASPPFKNPYNTRAGHPTRFVRP